MATVEVHTAARTAEIENNTIVGGEIDVNGHLILQKGDGTTIDAGSVMGTFSIATETNAGMVELATDAESQTGTDAQRAVTPFGLASVTATETRRGLVELATTAEAVEGLDTDRAVTPAGLEAALQDHAPTLDPDLQAIAALTPSNDHVLQRKAGAWTNRSMSNLAADLAAIGEWPDVKYWNGSSYTDTDAVHIHIGPNDPGALANGSIWFDTAGA